MPKFTDEMPMSATAYDHQTLKWAEMLEGMERCRTGLPKGIAREMIARRIGVAPGTLENLERGRTKGIRGWVHEKIRAAVIRELEREIARLQSELHLAQQSTNRPDADEVMSVLAALGAARTLIKQAAA